MNIKEHPDRPHLNYHLNYVVHPGQGPVALLVHGVLGSRSYWDDNLAALSQVCRPVVVELWGHGASPAPNDPSKYDPLAYVAEFEKIRVAVAGETSCERPGAIWVIGQSMGAALTLHYALARPENLIGIVLTNSASAFSDPDTWDERTKTITKDRAESVETNGLEVLRDSWLNPGRSKRISPHIRKKLDQEFSEHSTDGLIRSFRITNPQLPLGDRLAEISVPALLTNGVQEKRFQPLLSQARKIPGLEIVDLPASHAVNAHAPDSWNATVTAFISKAGLSANLRGAKTSQEPLAPQ